MTFKNQTQYDKTWDVKRLGRRTGEKPDGKW